MQYNNHNLDNPCAIAEAYNDYFGNIAPELNSKLPRSNRNPVNYFANNFLNSLLPVVNKQDKRCYKATKNEITGANEIAVFVLKRSLIFFPFPSNTFF